MSIRHINDCIPVEQDVNLGPPHRRWQTLLAQWLMTGAIFLMGSILPTYSFAATIEGHVFLDQNDNKIKDAGELTRANQVIYIKDDTTGQSFSASTNFDGHYSFLANNVGQYSLRINIPSGMKLTTPVTAKGLMRPYAVSISNASQKQTVNFGLSSSSATSPIDESTMIWSQKDDSMIVSNSEYVLRITPDKNATQVTEMQVVDKSGGFYQGDNTATEAVVGPLTSASTRRNAIDQFEIAVGKNISPTGEESKLAVKENSDGTYTFTDPDNSSISVTNELDGTLTAVDSTVPSLLTVVETDGQLTVTDDEYPTSAMTVGTDGQSVVVDSEYPGMAAVVNRDGSYTVTDTEFPELKTTVNPDGSYTVEDTIEGLTVQIDNQGNYSVVDADGNCVDLPNTRGWFKKIVKKVKKVFHKAASFVGKVAGFVRKAASFMIKALPVISKVALIVSKIAFALAPIFPPLCPALCAIGSFALGVSALASNPATKLFLEKVEKIAGGVENVANKVAMWTAPPPPLPPTVQPKPTPAQPQPVPVVLPPPPVLPNTTQGLIALNAINTAIGASQIWENGDQQTANQMFAQAEQTAQQSGIPQAINYVQTVKTMVTGTRRSHRIVRDGQRGCIAPPAAVLDYITVASTANNNLINWATLIEQENVGFNVYRAEKDAADQLINQVKINDALVPAQSEANWGANYEFTDITLLPNITYFYMVESVDAKGDKIFHEIVAEVPSPPPPATCELYGVQDQALNDAIFFRYDPQTNTTQQIGQTCKGCDIEAMDDWGEEIYVASGDDTRGHPKGYIYKLDTQTGTLNPVGDSGFEAITALAFDQQGTLWGWAVNKGLVRINTQTGQGTVVLPAPAVKASDLSWDLSGKLLYGVVGSQLWSYDPITGIPAQLCNNLPRKTEALEMLPTSILPEGQVLFGAHKAGLKLHAYDISSCQSVATRNVAIPYDDVEGLAMPIAACAAR